MATTTSMSDFTILSKIGTGAFSEVYKVFRKSDRNTYALKKVRTFFLNYVRHCELALSWHNLFSVLPL